MPYWITLDEKKARNLAAALIYGLLWTALDFFMVPGTGIEPVRPYGREILSLLCLPISPSGLRFAIIPACAIQGRTMKKGKCNLHFPFILEREKSLELSTYTLARYRSTN